MFVVFCLICKAGFPDQPTVEEIAKHAEEATVLIGTLDSSQSAVGQGSGFFVSPNLIVTNFHVVKEKSVIIYHRFGQEKFNSIRSIRGVDRKFDLALLEVSTSSVKPLFLGNNVSVRTGQLVHVMSYPRNFDGNLEGTFSTGRVSNAKRERFGRTDIQIDARGNPGSSGGPVLNSHGEVIGVVWSGDEDVLQIFAIPVKHLRALLTRHGVRLQHKPKSNSRKTNRKNEERAKAEAKKAEAEAERAKAEKAKAEARKAEAESTKVEAAKNPVEAKKAETEIASAETEKAKSTNELGPEEIAERALDSTVLLLMANARGELKAFGSGFFVQKNLIATNYHVIEGAARGVAKRVGQEEIYVVEGTLDKDKERDLAILKVSAPGAKPLAFGHSELVRIGQTIYVAGNPKGILEGTFSDGIISAIRADADTKLFQFTAPVSQGSSGGPVLNNRGEVIGIATLASVGVGQDGTVSQNINFAVAANHITDILKAHGVPIPRLPIAPTDDTEAERRRKAAIIEQLKATTVCIIGEHPNGEESILGSGFFVQPNQVATDFHVIEDSVLKGMRNVGKRATSVNVLLGDQPPKTDKKHHLAILKVERATVEPFSLGNSDDAKIGDPIYMVGDPSRGQVSEGKISDILEKDGVRYFQFDAEVSPGSSGGPIINSSGKVIAVTTLKVPIFSGTLKYAIPAIYLKGLHAAPFPPPEDKPEQQVPLDREPPSPPLHEQLLQRGIEHYEKTRFKDGIESLESALNGLQDPEIRAVTHLYLGFSKWGLAETESSVNADFREALRYNPDVELPPRIGQNHPVFRPLLEHARKESTGTLAISASPPEAEIKIYGGEVQPKLPDDRTEPIRLFKGNYAVEGILDGAHKVMPVLIEPGDRRGITLSMQKTPVPEHEFELTLELYSAEKPKEVMVHYTTYDASGNQLGPEEKKEMQLREHKPETSIWVYHVKLPSATQGGKIVYRIETDGEVIPGRPMEVEILEPPANALIEANQSIPIKARVISNVEVSEVRVVYDAPTTLADTSLSQKLEKESSSNTYKGKIPARRNHSDGTTWYYVTATNKSGENTISATRAVRAKRLSQDPPKIAVIKPPGTGPLPINRPINFEAKVKSSAPLKEVRIYYDFPRKRLSETSPSSMLENKSSSDTYIGKIPKEHNREEGYIWYFVMATTEKGVKSQTEDSVIEVKKLPTWRHEGVWASHSWSSHVAENTRFVSDWERGNLVSLAYLREGKGFQILGAQLDFGYENPINTSAIVQWGPRMKGSAIAFAFLAGIAGYRDSDSDLVQNSNRPTQLTPLVGGSLKLYPLDRVVVDVTGSIKLRSENSASDRSSSFTKEYLHHYEMGIRLYISPTLNLRAGYGRWRLGEYYNTGVQVGLGVTF